MHRAGDAALELAHFARQALAGVQHDLRVVVEREPRLGRRDAARLALQQLDAEHVLEVLDAAGQRRLADRDPLGGARQVAGVDHCDEVTKLA